MSGRVATVKIAQGWTAIRLELGITLTPNSNHYPNPSSRVAVESNFGPPF